MTNNTEPLLFPSSNVSPGDNLWPTDRVPVTNDDLLLELENLEITQSIQCLYQVGAHRFEEYETITRLFPSLTKIVLFEPNPELFKLLTDRFSGNTQIQVLPFALADRNGSAEFFISNNDGHSSSLLPLGKHRDIFPHVSYERSIHVEQLTLPEAIARHQLPSPDMLFIDAQGAECKILSALTPDLKEKVKIIYVEASLEEVYQGAGTLDELKNRLHSQFKFAGYAPQNRYTPTHGNAIFINAKNCPLRRMDKRHRPEATNSDKKLPIGVLIPTRNVMSSLESHLKNLNTWAKQVEEIIVVDSQSTDGTVDFIQKNLPHPKLRIFNRPPGLYEAWNYGIQQIQSKYTYVSTIGDDMSREGLEHLVETAEKFESDLVLSKPRFIDAEGKPIPNFRWPIYDIIDELAMKEPGALTTEQALYYAVRFGAHSILGSSASNLYRTEILQKNPFPTDFGHAGDTAWGILNAAKSRFAITPKAFSSFVLDPKYQQESTDGFPTKVFWLSCQVITELMQTNPELFQKDKKILQAVAEAGTRMLHEGQPFQQLNSKLQHWAETAEKNLASERKLSKEYRQWAEDAEARVQRLQRLQQLKRHWWVRLGQKFKVVDMKKLEC